MDYNLKADRVLVDPPCTAFGVTPKLAFEPDSEKVENLSAYQKQFLTAAANIVKPGGTVVYSVCTITSEECEDMVEFAQSQLGLEQVEADPFVVSNKSGLSKRFDPETDGSGYFIARFIKA